MNCFSRFCFDRILDTHPQISTCAGMIVHFFFLLFQAHIAIASALAGRLGGFFNEQR